MIPREFLLRMQRLLGEEFHAFSASYDTPRNVGLRLNPLKKHSFPALEEFHLSPVPWAEHGFYYDPATRPGLSPYHEAGVYYIQEPSAMAPAELLDVRPGMRVLDLCAAPGGKSTQLAAKLMGQGLLVSNEIHPQRAKILSRNLERCSVKNALCLNEHPAALEKRFSGFFDRVLVDAPCSGEGMFRKEEAAGQDWSMETVQMCARRQDEILRCAGKMLRPGGRLVYSTCTFSPEENEGVISRFLRENPEFSLVKLENPHFSAGQPSWVEDGQEELRYCFRLFPHKLRGEGHFAAVLEKAAGEGPHGPAGLPGIQEPGELRAFREELGLRLPEGKLLAFGQTLYLAPKDTPDLRGLKVLRPGLELGQILKNRFQPAHAWALALEGAKRVQELPPESPEVRNYLAGQTLPTEYKGWTLLTTGGFSLGWGKGADGILKNHFPKGLRRASAGPEEER